MIVAGPFRWHGATVRVAPGHVYTRGGPGIEAVINAGDRRGGWGGRGIG